MNNAMFIPLCRCEPKEEEEADKKDEGDGAAHVGHGPHSRDGHRLLHIHQVGITDYPDHHQHPANPSGLVVLCQLGCQRLSASWPPTGAIILHPHTFGMRTGWSSENIGHANCLLVLLARYCMVLPAYQGITWFLNQGIPA